MGSLSVGVPTAEGEEKWANRRDLVDPATLSLLKSLSERTLVLFPRAFPPALPPHAPSRAPSRSPSPPASRSLPLSSRESPRNHPKSDTLRRVSGARPKPGAGTARATASGARPKPGAGTARATASGARRHPPSLAPLPPCLPPSAQQSRIAAIPPQKRPIATAEQGTHRTAVARPLSPPLSSRESPRYRPKSDTLRLLSGARERRRRGSAPAPANDEGPGCRSIRALQELARLSERPLRARREPRARGTRCPRT